MSETPETISDNNETTIADYDESTSNVEPENEEYQPEMFPVDETVIRDADGEEFDPQRHESDEEGKPRYTKRNRFRKKRGARKSTDPGPSVISGPGVEPPADIHKLNGRLGAQVLESAGFLLFGDEGAYIKDGSVDERTQVEQAFAEYSRAKDMSDIPPGVLLGIVIVGYGGRRFQSPKTRDRIGAVKYWFSSKFGRRKNDNRTRPDSGTDAERKEHAGQTTGAAE